MVVGRYELQGSNPGCSRNFSVVTAPVARSMSTLDAWWKKMESLAKWQLHSSDWYREKLRTLILQVLQDFNLCMK